MNPKYFLVGYGLAVVFLGIFALVRMEVVSRNRIKIIDAIFAYQTFQLHLGNIDHTDFYSKMETFEQTERRIWDWGYTRILPPNYFKLIEPFIER